MILITETRLEVSAYLSFRGDCAAAFKFYEEVLGAKPGLLFRYADSPMGDIVPDGWENKVMHGSVKTFWSERFGMVVDRFGIP